MADSLGPHESFGPSVDEEKDVALDSLGPGVEDEKDVALVRMVPEVVEIPSLPMASEQLFNPGGTINIINLRAHLLKEGRLQKMDILKIVETASSLFAEEPNLLNLRDPITVCGDIHGQFFDLVKLIDVAGQPKKTKYLFLGDYVDRGNFSTEVIIYLFAHKITYAKTFFMTRGNHECRHLTQFYNFQEECLYKYDLEVYDCIMNAFDNLPIAATINRKFFCVHGGLSPDISTLNDIFKIDRKRETPREGPFCDLLWSDPDPQVQSGEEAIKDGTTATNWFTFNENRQCSYVYGIDAVKQFLKKNNLMAIIRGHEAQEDGYKFNMSEGPIPKVVTIFSAPNYCDVYNNKGACLQFDKDRLKIKQYGASPHPYYLPNFMDVFTWSLPFLTEKVGDMLYHLLGYGSYDDEDVKVDTIEESSKPFNADEEGVHDLMAKLDALARFRKIAKTRKEHSDKIVKLKSLSLNRKMRLGLLFEGSSAIDDALDSFESFEDVQKNDLAMEAMPTIEMKPGEPGKPDRRMSGRTFTFRDMDLNEVKLNFGFGDGLHREDSYSLTVEDTEKEISEQVQLSE